MTAHRGGHRRSGGRGIGFLPSVLVYELGCDPNDSFYQDCIARSRSQFGIDVLEPQDLRAIRVYFDATPVKTAEGQNIKDDFIKWYDGLGPIDVFAQGTLDLARNQRNRFNLANATTAEEKTQVQEVMKTGLSEEQMKGEPDRRNADGMLPGPQKPPLIPQKYWVYGGIAASLALIASAYGYAKR